MSRPAYLAAAAALARKSSPEARHQRRQAISSRPNFWPVIVSSASPALLATNGHQSWSASRSASQACRSPILPSVAAILTRTPVSGSLLRAPISGSVKRGSRLLPIRATARQRTVSSFESRASISAGAAPSLSDQNASQSASHSGFDGVSSSSARGSTARGSLVFPSRVAALTRTRSSSSASASMRAGTAAAPAA